LSLTNQQLEQRLFLAAQKGNIKEVKDLIPKVRKPLSLSTPVAIDTARSLVNCSYRNNNQLDILKLLSDNGVDFNIASPSRDALTVNSQCRPNKKAFNNTDLMAQDNTIEIAKFLIENGANPKRRPSHSPNEVGLSALAIAILRENEPLAIYLAKYSDVTKRDIELAMHRHMEKLVLTLIDGGIDYAKYPFIKWAINNSLNDMRHTNVLIALFNKGIDPNNFIIYQDFYEHPIIYAAYTNNLSAIKTLILYGAKTDVTDSNGRSVMDIAIKEKNHALIEYLGTL